MTTGKSCWMAMALLAAISTPAFGQGMGTAASDQQAESSVATADAPPTAEQQQMLAAVRKQWKYNGMGDMTPQQETMMLRKFRQMRGNLAANMTMMRMAAGSASAQPSPTPSTPAHRAVVTRSAPSSNPSPAANAPVSAPPVTGPVPEKASSSASQGFPVYASYDEAIASHPGQLLKVNGHAGIAYALRPFASHQKAMKKASDPEVSPQIHVGNSSCSRSLE
jgi:hypothetical protein